MRSVQIRYLSTTLLLVALAAAVVAVQGKGEHPAPRLERRLDTASQPLAPPPAPPSARRILDHRAALSLSTDQVARLEDLDQRWRRDSRALLAAVERAQEEFAQFMDAQGERASLQEVQRQSAEFRELSAELREQRLRHAEAAAGFLTDGQGRTLTTMTMRSPERQGEGR